MPTASSPRPAADGERNALGGFLPQYLVGAEKVLHELSVGALDSVVLGDADAGRLDDFQLVSERDDGLWLHAYQVKWSANREVIGDAELRGLIADAVEGLGKIRKAREGLEMAAPITSYRAHIYSNRPPSGAGLRGAFAGRGLSVARFLAEVWSPAGRGDLSTLDEVPECWRGYLGDLAERCGLEATALLKAATEIVVELRQALPEDKASQDREGARFLRDVREIAAGMKRLVIDPDRPSVLPVADFLQALGPEWAGRGRRRSEHEFPLPRGLKPIKGAIERLREAIDSNGGGYVFLLGSPGSGKSTLLTHVLRLDARLAARYYAFVPGKDTRTRGEASAFLHDLLLALSGGRALLPPESDVALMRERLRDSLRKLGEQAKTHGTVSIILVDGLDHVLRDPEPRDPFLAELPAPDEIPEGVLIVLGTRGRADLPTHVAPAATAQRVVETEPLSRPAVLELAREAGVSEQGQRVFELSEGHPLLTQTYVSLVRDLPAADRSATLSALQPLQGR
jgi:energy-coupling factor transporter ATP-binding protein EcfA2